MNSSTPRTTDIVTDKATDGDPLAERHRHELEQNSGLSPEIIAERGYRTARTIDDLPPGVARLAPALVLPHYDAEAHNGRYTTKPVHPRTNRDGDLVKYESQQGLPPPIDMHPRSQRRLADHSVPIVWGEGIKKGDKFTDDGYCAVALNGVWGWVRHPKIPLEALQPILAHVDGRLNILCFDSDPKPTTVANVTQALEALGELLESRGALVVRVTLPAAPGEKVGYDDYRLTHSLEDFRALVQAAILKQLRQAQQASSRTREMERERSALFELLRNEKVPAARRICQALLLNEHGSRSSRGLTVEPWRPVITPRDPAQIGLAKRFGFSKDTVSAAIDDLALPGGVFVKDSAPITSADGHKIGEGITLRLAADCPTDIPGQYARAAQLGQPRVRKAAAPRPPTRAQQFREAVPCREHPNDSAYTVCSGGGEVLFEHAPLGQCSPVTEISAPVEDDAPYQSFPPSPIDVVGEIFRSGGECQDDNSDPEEFDPDGGHQFEVQARWYDEDETLLGDQDDNSEPLILEIEAPPAPRPPRPESIGKCPGCLESWTPRKGSTATLCGVCTFYARQQASAVVQS